MKAGHYGSAVGMAAGLGTAGLCSDLLITVVLLTLLVMIPSGIFALVSWVLISVQLYQHPELRMFLLGSTTVVVLLVGIAALLARGRWLRKGGRVGGGERLFKGFAWWSALFALSLSALVAGSVIGTGNYNDNFRQYYEVSTLQVYPDVNPARTQGQQLLDAGVVTFEMGSALDVNRSMGFTSKQTYCVAPIIAPSTQALPAVFDFWAAGTNCCSSGGNDFRCGAYDNSMARGGLRLMDQDATNFKLAVQQAQVAYHIKSAHPLFFEWVSDPISELNAKKDQGLSVYKRSVCLAAGVTLGIVSIGFVYFWLSRHTD